MITIQNELHDTVKLYRSGQTLKAFLMFSALLDKNDPHYQRHLKTQYRLHYFHDPSLLDLSFYFLLHCNETEKDLFCLEWFNHSINNFSASQRFLIKDFYRIISPYY